MNIEFSDELPFVFFDSKTTADRLRGLLTGMESDAAEHPLDPTLQTSVRILRLFDGTDKNGNPGYIVAFGRMTRGLQPLRVDTVNGTDDATKIAAAKVLIGEGGEPIGFSDFPAGNNTETAVIYRRGAAASNTIDGTNVANVIADPGHDMLKKLQAMNPQVDNALHLAGLARGGLQTVKNAAGKVGLIMITDCDIDTDGPGGSKDKDPFWLPKTSLRDDQGNSCNSRTFPGVVVPPEIVARFGVRMGDFGLVFHDDKVVPCQVYDGGPAGKIGEVSVGLAWMAGVPPVPPSGANQQVIDEVESRAARRGNNVLNLVTLIFPGSGSKKAESTDTINKSASVLFKDLTA